MQLSDPAPLPELIMLGLKEEGIDADCSENADLKQKIAEVPTFPLCLSDMLQAPQNTTGSGRDCASRRRSVAGVCT